MMQDRETNVALDEGICKLYAARRVFLGAPREQVPGYVLISGA